MHTSTHTHMYSCGYNSILEPMEQRGIPREEIMKTHYCTSAFTCKANLGTNITVPKHSTAGAVPAVFLYHHDKLSGLFGFPQF